MVNQGKSRQSRSSRAPPELLLFLGTRPLAVSGLSPEVCRLTVRCGPAMPRLRNLVAIKELFIAGLSSAVMGALSHPKRCATASPLDRNEAPAAEVASDSKASSRWAVSPAPTCPLTAFKRSDRLCRRDTQDSRSCEMHPRSGRIWRRGNSRKPKVDSATGRLRSGTEVSRLSLLPPLNNSKANQHRADERH